MDTSSLIKKAHTGDKMAREQIVEGNIGLVWSIVKRFLGRGVELDDLFQIGVIGLIKAIDKFDFNYNVQFSTYAVPMISGEIKRFLRDDGIIKVSRGLKELSYKAMQTGEELRNINGKDPTLLEVAISLNVKCEDLVIALESQNQVDSLQKTIYHGEGEEILLEDKILDENEIYEKLLNKITLEKEIKKLNKKEKAIIVMRYFMEKSQTEIAKELGVSQVQISRMEKKILLRMRKNLDQ